LLFLECQANKAVPSVMHTFGLSSMHIWDRFWPNGVCKVWWKRPHHEYIFTNFSNILLRHTFLYILFYIYLSIYLLLYISLYFQLNKWMLFFIKMHYNLLNLRPSQISLEYFHNVFIVTSMAAPVNQWSSNEKLFLNCVLSQENLLQLNFLSINFSQIHTMTMHIKLRQQHCSVLRPKKLTPRWDSNSGSSVLEANAMTTMPHRQDNF
jgi:hypothetical protein